MKMRTIAAKNLFLWLLVFFAPVVLFAQESSTKVDINVHKESSAWYTNPVIWIIGAAVFILLLVALLRGGNSSKS